RRDHQNLSQRVLPPRLQQHPAHRRIHRQTRQLPPQIRQISLPVQRPQILQQRVTGLDRPLPRRIDKRKRLHLPQPKRFHPQNHRRHIRPQNLRRRKPRPALEVLFRIQPNANPLRPPPATPFPLIRAALRNRLHRQPLRPRVRTEPADPRRPRIDYKTDSRNRQRSLRDIRRDHDFPLLQFLENPLLVPAAQPPEKRQHLAMRQPPPLHNLPRFANVPLPPHENQKVPRLPRLHDFLARRHRRLDRRDFPFLLQKLIERPIINLHRKR